MKHICFFLVVFTYGCASPKYCSREYYAAEKEEFNSIKCGAAVTADVLLSAVIILGAVAAAQSGTSKSGSNLNYDGNCACPADLDKQGNRCGLRSAYSRMGGAEPYCAGRL